MKLRSVSFLGGALLLAACGAGNANSGKGFSTNWQNDNGSSIAAVEQRLHALPLVPNARVAVGVTDTGLVATTLDGKSRWTHAGKSVALPVIAGTRVITQEGDQIVALDAANGSTAWTIPSQSLALRGAGSDGTSTALVLANSHKSLFLAISPSGATLSSLETEAGLGVPAARGGIAFVPWSNQYVSAVDMSSGD